MADDANEPVPLDPKEASRWITAQVRAKKETARHPSRPTDPMPLDPAEASKLIAERIRAKGKTAHRPVAMSSDEVLLARPIKRQRLLALIQADAEKLLEGHATESGTLQAVPISLAEFEWLARGGKRTRRLQPARRPEVDHDAPTRVRPKPGS